MNKTKGLDGVLKEFLPILEKQLAIADSYPVRIGDKYGLVEGGELSDEDEAKAKQEWKDTYSRIIFLIKELDEKTCTSLLAKKANDLLDMKIIKMNIIKGYTDNDFSISDGLKTSYEELCEEYDEAESKLNIYFNECKNELFDLLKTWWWDLLSY